jgi:hypothetical protein
MQRRNALCILPCFCWNQFQSARGMECKHIPVYHSIAIGNGVEV